MPVLLAQWRSGTGPRREVRLMNHVIAAGYIERKTVLCGPSGKLMSLFA